MRTRISLRALLEIARNLKAEDGDNPEYDRALIEVCTEALGLSMDERAVTAKRLGIAWRG